MRRPRWANGRNLCYALIAIWALLILVLALGCAGPGDVEIGVGKSWGGGSFSGSNASGGAASGFTHNSDYLQTFDYDEGDQEAAWIAWTIPLGPKQITVVDRPEPLWRPAGTSTASLDSDEEEPISIDWTQLGIGLALGMASLFGAQKGREKWVEHKERKEAQDEPTS
jgi:hypothetical protein